MTQIPDSWRLDGRTCVLTGATAGIGRHAASLFVRLGADLVLVGRDAARVNRVVADAKRDAPGAKVIGMAYDLASQSQVRSLAARIHSEVPAIHVLINNAGVVTLKRTVTDDGIETQFAVNYLAPFLLTNLLLDRLADSAPSRVVSVASQVERGGEIDFDDLQQSRGKYDGWKAYRQSKLAIILFTRALAARVAARGITPISVHPGVYTTNLLGDLMGWSRLVTRFRGRGLPGPEGGALVLARAAAAPELEGRAGAHLHEHAEVAPSRRAQDEEVGRRLWVESERLTGLNSTKGGNRFATDPL